MPDAIGLKRAFQTLYGSTPRLFSAPGRVNLIGEHTDYNEGFVLPMAVNRRTLVAAAGRKDSQIRIRSFDIERDGSFNLNETRTENSDHWLAYIEGVARLLKADGEHIVGANLAVSSDVPLGAGLSSS